MARDNGLRLERLQPIEVTQPLSKARMRTRKRWLSSHGKIAGKENALGSDPYDRVACGVIRAYREDLCLHAAKIEVVFALERDIRLAEFGILQQLGICARTTGEYLGELPTEFGDISHLVGGPDQDRCRWKSLGAEVVLRMNMSGDKVNWFGTGQLLRHFVNGRAIRWPKPRVEGSYRSTEIPVDGPDVIG